MIAVTSRTRRPGRPAANASSGSHTRRAVSAAAQPACLRPRATSTAAGSPARGTGVGTFMNVRRSRIALTTALSPAAVATAAPNAADPVAATTPPATAPAAPRTGRNGSG